MKKITQVRVLAERKLELTFSDGKTIQVDFSSKIEPNTVTAPLADVDFFNRVKVAQAGRAIEWPGEIDFCADALWIEGSKEENLYLKKSKAS